jgi:superfamily I DNA and/or RNA helicase
VLTPYRQQLRVLQGSDLVRPHLSTVHAFQGREADVVVVSLVRDSTHGAIGRAAVRAGLGHLAQKELANVLFSRARRQLIVIGRFDHYAHVMSRDGFWTDVCRAVDLYGSRVSAFELFGDLTGMAGGADDLFATSALRGPWA